MTEDMLVHHRDRLRAIGRRYGALRIRVFGSRARGTATTSSDLDLLADFEPGRSLLDLIGLKQDLEDFLECKVDILTEDSLSPYLREKILRDARDL
jgi:uncharacterized protein